ncbi:hypothetical protein L596_008848 [Steinernema carpocapsae]|uniref:Uncharacterized protein n=1 Tax=Steinernema carpocapsae TaxID=34508 RepID=A0A4U5PE73_STECR|nr:hypothetical protein L596_008848 [Steinernema carpocapsae]
MVSSQKKLTWSGHIIWTSTAYSYIQLLKKHSQSSYPGARPIRISVVANSGLEDKEDEESENEGLAHHVDEWRTDGKASFMLQKQFVIWMDEQRQVLTKTKKVVLRFQLATARTIRSTPISPPVIIEMWINLYFGLI